MAKQLLGKEVTAAEDAQAWNRAGHPGVEFWGQVDKIVQTGKANAHPPSMAAQKIVGKNMLIPVLSLGHTGADVPLSQPLHNALEGDKGSLGVPVVIRPIEILFQRLGGA